MSSYSSRRHSMTVTQALGWALLHSLWQCALAAAALAALLAVLPARAARIRYALAAATLALTLALPMATLLRLQGGRPVRLLRWTLVPVPAVLGWVRPVILLPASALTGLTPLQLEALLAHELAHVRRYDYLVNLIQSVIETLLFYHPAVWWISARVRDEREHCCDDLAVAGGGDAHFYATALLGMERLRVTPPAFALAAAGRGGALMGRIRRLVAPVQAEIFPRWMAGVVAVTPALGGGAHLARGAPATGDRGGMPT